MTGEGASKCMLYVQYAFASCQLIQLFANLCRDAFVEFAELCFKHFGDRVKHWITFNEIHSFAVNGFHTGIDAPGRCSKPFGNCSAGNSKVEPLIVTHNVLIAHAQAVNSYRTNFQVSSLIQALLTMKHKYMYKLGVRCSLPEELSEIMCVHEVVYCTKI